MPVANYAQTVKMIESLGIMPDRVPSLEPMRRALQLLLPDLNIPQDRVIVVAGTNGKGSICATLETLLLAAGQKVGLYTSPHLEETTERIRINGQNISKENFCTAYEMVHKRTDGIRLSHFEMLTLMAAWVFFSKTIYPELDWFIFEVGLGGTWDATNSIPHRNCVIASLGYDHQNLLGQSLREIAENKFGIIQTGAKVIYSPLPQEVHSLAQQVQISTQSRWKESIPFELQVSNSDHPNEPSFYIQTEWGKGLLNLPGKRGAQNTATALTVFHELGFNPSLFLHSLAKVNWSGRMEKMNHPDLPCPVYLSGDHNPPGVQSLLEILPFYPRQKLHIIVGVGKDKDLEGIMEPLFNIQNASIYLTETPFRGRNLDEYGPWLNRAAGAWKDAYQTLNQVISKASANDMILVTGSLYLVGLLRHKLIRS